MRIAMRSRGLALVMVAANIGALVSTALHGLAQAPPPPATTAPPNQSKIDEARQRYERGLKLYDDGAYDAARSEFERAYALAPSYKLLYNIGLVYAQISDFVGAIRNLERYLAEGGDNVPAARQAEVRKILEELRPRVATIKIHSNVDGADVFVDDVLSGHTPLAAPLTVNPGRRKVTASKQGYLPMNKVVDLAGGDRIEVGLDLTAPVSRTIYVGTPTRRIPWVGWAITGVLAAGGGVFGYLAINQSNTLSNNRASPNADPNLLSSESKRTRIFSVTADVLGIGAIAVGAISLYYTIKWGKTENEGKPNALRIAPTPFGLDVSSTF